MKIIFVTPYYYPSIGGVQNYVKNIAEGLYKKYNYRSVIITSSLDNKYKEEIINGLKVYRLPYWFRISNSPINPLWYFQIKKIIMKENPKIINLHSPVPFIADIAAIIARSNNIPFILTYHSGHMKKGKFLIDKFLKIYEMKILKKIIDNASLIISIYPEFLKKELKIEKNIFHITPGVNTNIFKPKKTNIQNTILYVGRIEKNSEMKGIKYILDAIKIIKTNIQNIKLVIVGDGDALKSYKEYTKQLGLTQHVAFLGFQKGKKLVSCYQNSNLLILPSYTDAESFGIVLIEAMACKKPVIGTNVGGIPFIIKHEKNGLLIPSKNSKAIAKAVIEILSNSKLATIMGENGYNRVIKEFTWEKQIEKSYKLFNTL